MSSSAPAPLRTPRGEKISREGGRAVLRRSAETFLTRGAGSARNPLRASAHVQPHMRAPKAAGNQDRYRRRNASHFARLSAMVLRLWQEWQRLCRLLRSVNFDQSPLCGSTWSTSVALVRIPRCAHSRQNGSLRSCSGRRSSTHSGVRYIQCQDLDSSLRRVLSLGLWAAQYPPGTRTQQPGCRHGLSGFCAIGLSPPGKTKEPGPTRPRFAVHVAQAHWLRLKSIFKNRSRLQWRQ